MLALGPAVAAGDPDVVASTTAAEVRSIASSVMADAERRTSLAGPGSVGYDRGFFISSESGQQRLTISAVTQFRYQYYFRRAAESEQGFTVARMRLLFGGQVRDGLTFQVRIGLTGTTPVPGFEERPIRGVAELERAWAQIAFDPNWSLRLGTQVFYLTRESEHAPQNQLGVNASPTNSVFGAGGFEGAQVHALYEHVRAWFTVSNGIRSVNGSLDEAADVALSFKGDWKLAGEWSRFKTFTSFPGSEFAAMIGAGIHWEDGTIADQTPDASVVLFVSELSVEGDGWNAYAALHVNRNDIDTDGDRIDAGVVVQGGVFVTKDVELYGRFDAIFPDPDRATDSDAFRTVTVGFNHYPLGHTVNAKLSVDCIVFLDNEDESIVRPSISTGVLAGTRAGDFGVRVQFTMAF